MTDEFYIESPAKGVAKLICAEVEALDEFERRLESTTAARELLISTKNRTLKKTAVAQAFGDRNRVRNLRRDRNRAAIRLTALREALAMVLLAVACADGEPHPVPNPDVYLSRCGGA